ncbi:hypothetical protein [Acinetobacter pragensis]|uniref:Uncharacterized protein n=1 Tax=Acinetobacter pragensis TaxID=1806892 RepID=A0A151Y5V8_9GAMM|nr:hypothetical protein [Acinetobacter pragensis]KYQ73415.1 hypothetical protein AZH43_05810 [Acinetobacter pragensis]
MKQDFLVIISIIAIYAIYSKKHLFLNLIDKNIYLSNTNLLYKRTKEALLEKNVIKKGNKIYIYEINKLRSNGKLIKTMEINKIPFKIKTKNSVKYAKVPLKMEIQKDLK